MIRHAPAQARSEPWHTTVHGSAQLGTVPGLCRALCRPQTDSQRQGGGLR